MESYPQYSFNIFFLFVYTKLFFWNKILKKYDMTSYFGINKIK